jgi:hypothetical protein
MKKTFTIKESDLIDAHEATGRNGRPELIKLAIEKVYQIKLSDDWTITLEQPLPDNTLQIEFTRDWKQFKKFYDQQ